MSHPENSTGPTLLQEPGHLEPETSPKVPAFSREQQAFVVGLLKAERGHASRWWTFCNELRLRGDLPEWVARQDVGRHADYDRWNEDCMATNRELLGLAHHLNGFDPGALVDETVGTWLRNEVAPDDSAPQNTNLPIRGAEVAGVQ